MIISTKKRLLTIAFLLLASGVALFKVSGKPLNYPLNWVALAIGMVCIIYLSWMLFGDVRVTIKEKFLIIQKRCLGVPFFKNSYNISSIKNIQIARNTKANSYWSLGRHSSKYFRIYDINPIVIYFDYNGKQIKIGEGLEEFNAEEILNKIRRSRTAE